MVNGKGRKILDDDEKAILGLFGGELKHLLEESHITQKQMAQDLGLSKTSVNTWAKGNKQPQFIQLREIILYFLKNKNLTNFYPIDLLVPDFNVKGSDTEIEIAKLKSQLNSEYNKYKNKNEKIEKQQISEEALEKEWDELEQERKVLEKEKKSYYKKIKGEMFKKKVSEKAWTPREIARQVIKMSQLKELIQEKDLDERKIVDRLNETISETIINKVYELYPFLKPDVDV